MTSLRVVAANRTPELGRLSGAARPDQLAGNASFPDALDSAANAEEMSPNSKSPSDPKFETSSSEARSEPTGPRTRSAQRTDGEPPRDATRQTSLGDQMLSVASPVAAQTAGSASADQFEPGSDRPSTGPNANALTMPQAEIGDDDARRHPIRRSGHEAGAGDAAVAVAIIHATDARSPRQSSAGSAINGERNVPAAVSPPTSGAPLLDLPGGGPGSETPRDSSAGNASSFPLSPSPDSASNDGATVAAAYLAVTSHTTDAVGSVVRETSAFSPVSASSAIDPGPDTLRQGTASPATDAVDSVLRETSAFSPASVSSGIEPGPDVLRGAPAIA